MELRHCENCGFILDCYPASTDNSLKIINMTPHDVTIFLSDPYKNGIKEEAGYCDNNIYHMSDWESNIKKVFKSKGCIRLEEEKIQIPNVDYTPTFQVKYKKGNLPGEIEGVYYIVSIMILQAFPERKDFITPFDIVRDEKGVIKGCLSFQKI